MIKGSWEMKLALFLLKYTTTSQTMMGMSPAQLLMEGKIRAYLDVDKEVLRKQAFQKQNHDYHTQDRELGPKDLVYNRSFNICQPTRIPGIILKPTGPFVFQRPFK